jgi:hypothetical protein
MSEALHWLVFCFFAPIVAIGWCCLAGLTLATMIRTLLCLGDGELFAALVEYLTCFFLACVSFVIFYVCYHFSEVLVP